MNHIRSYAHIRNRQLSVNGQLLFAGQTSESQASFFTEAYKALNMSYPKFHKMDALCKLGMLCAEAVLKDTDFLEKHLLDQVAIVLSNRASSLGTDRHHQESISDKSNYFPSPAVFVYTLPNIIIGEMAIKYKITGENAFFVSEAFDAETLAGYPEALLGGSSDAVVAGWVEMDGDKAEAFIFLIEKSENRNKSSNFKPLNQQTLTELYNNPIWTH